jgi:hypothetical protein
VQSPSAAIRNSNKTFKFCLKNIPGVRQPSVAWPIKAGQFFEFGIAEVPSVPLAFI